MVETPVNRLLEINDPGDQVAETRRRLRRIQAESCPDFRRVYLRELGTVHLLSRRAEFALELAQVRQDRRHLVGRVFIHAV